MNDALSGIRVAFVVANEGVEQVELSEPWRAVLEAGGRPDLIAPRSGEAQAMHHLDKADRFPVDRITDEARAEPVAAICHGPWTLIDGDLVTGRTVTSWPSLQTDLRNAGATWVDEKVVVCRRGINVLITSRKPDDLDDFCRALTGVFAETRPVESRVA